MVKITRRDFTKLAAGAGVAAASVHTETHAARPVSANDKITMALIGCGGMGRGLLSFFHRCPEIEIVALCDVDDAQIKHAGDNLTDVGRKRPEGYKDFRRVIDRDDVNVIVNATPDHWHAIPTIMACQAGKDVYVEKPLALTIGEGRAMVNAARKHDRVVQMGTHQRSSDHYRKTADMIQNAELAGVRLVRAWAFLDWVGELEVKPDGPPPAGVDYDLWLGPAPERPFNPNRFHFNFRWYWDYSGGLMTDWGTHMLDIVNMATGFSAPKAAYSTGGKYGFPKDAQETPDTQHAVLEYEGYFVVWEHATGIGLGPWQREHGIEFHGRKGILVVDRSGWEVHSETMSTARGREYKMMPVPRRGGDQDYHFKHVRNFVDCVKSRERPVSDVAVGHDSTKACHLANIAMRVGRRVVWDDRKEEIVGDPEANALTQPRYRAPWKLPEV